jgi:hypothetical protein
MFLFHLFLFVLVIVFHVIVPFVESTTSMWMVQLHMLVRF